MLPACLPPRDASRSKVPPDQVVQRRILVANPAKLHGFPN
jgi:hypothetical protein